MMTAEEWTQNACSQCLMLCCMKEQLTVTSTRLMKTFPGLCCRVILSPSFLSINKCSLMFLCSRMPSWRRCQSTLTSVKFVLAASRNRVTWSGTFAFTLGRSHMPVINVARLSLSSPLCSHISKHTKAVSHCRVLLLFFHCRSW